MIIAPSVVIAIEAKYTEPPYENVDHWRHRPRDPNRCAVLRGWLDMLEMGTSVHLPIDAVLQLPYQLIHRAASACCPAAVHRAVIYQVFDVGRRDYYFQELGGLRALMPAAALKLGVLATPATASAGYASLLARRDRGERRMAREVRSALVDGQVFSFAEPSLLLA
ncbi:MAG: hypothetical protein HY217_00305 [Candidatus Rokubacteria bacterium]|nr:hypothetical protein [Candidatus Rokubacteria bacterium]